MDNWNVALVFIARPTKEGGEGAMNFLMGGSSFR